MKLVGIVVPRQIIILLLLTCTLNIFRVMAFGATAHMYIFWNIFLAVLPFALSSTIRTSSERKRIPPFLFVLSCFVWLLLLPNAPYLITDLVHVTEGLSSHAFYNTLVLFSAALSGLLLAFYSLFDMEQVFIIRFGKKKMVRMIGSIILITSFGVCVGRFLRFNSWDMFAQPLPLFTGLSSVFSHPYLYTQVYFLTAAFFFFLLCSYYAWKVDKK